MRATWSSISRPDASERTIYRTAKSRSGSRHYARLGKVPEGNYLRVLSFFSKQLADVPSGGSGAKLQMVL